MTQEIRNKLTVFGYVRQRATVFVPVDIIKIFVAYFKSQDDWDTLLSHSSIKIGEDYIAENSPELNATWKIAFGRDGIKKSVKEWKFRVFQIDSVIIGIIPSDQIHKQHNSGDFTA